VFNSFVVDFLLAGFFSTSTLDESLGDDIIEEHNRWNIWEEDYR
jgi:hypothetical protein